MRPSTTARRYAEAAYDVARQDNDVAGWLADLREVSGTLGAPQYAHYFAAPSVPRENKVRALGELFPRAHPHVLNLLRMLAVRDRTQLVPQILMAMEALDRAGRGITEADVTVARPVDDGEREEIARRLSQATGKTVQVHTTVDPTILGGIVVRIGDQLIDASVRGRLERLRHELAV